MNADASAEPDIDERGGLVDMAPTGRDQTHREFARAALVSAPPLLSPQPVWGPVTPQLPRSCHEQIGDSGAEQIGGERPERAPEAGLSGGRRRCVDRHMATLETRLHARAQTVKTVENRSDSGPVDTAVLSAK